MKNIKINTKIIDYLNNMVNGNINRIKTVYKTSVYITLFNTIFILFFTFCCIITTNSRLFYSTINFPLISITFITFWLIDIFSYLIKWLIHKYYYVNINNKFMRCLLLWDCWNYNRRRNIKKEFFYYLIL